MNKFRKTLVVVFSALFLLCTALFAAACNLQPINTAKHPDEVETPADSVEPADPQTPAEPAGPETPAEPQTPTKPEGTETPSESQKPSSPEETKPETKPAETKPAYAVSVANDADLGSYTLTEANNGDGYVEGTVVTLKVSPKKGYDAKLRVNGKEVALDEDGIASFAVTENTEVTIDYTYRFVIYTYVTEGEGTIAPAAPKDKVKYAEGEEVAVTVTPAEGYTLGRVLVNGEKVQTTEKEGAYTLNVTVDGRKYVVAEFVALHTVTVENDAAKGPVKLKAGSTDITLTAKADDANTSTSADIEEGTVVTLTVEEKAGETVKYLVVNGAQFAYPEGGFIFELKADTTITVVYDTYYTVTLPAPMPTGATLTLSEEHDDDRYLAGTVLTLNVELEHEHRITKATITIGEEESDITDVLTNLGHYTFEVTGNVTIDVEVKPYKEVVTYSVTLTKNNDSYGKATLSEEANAPKNQYYYNTQLTLTVEANPGYKVNYVTDNGARVDLADKKDGTFTYTFHVTQDTNIHVVFVATARYTVRFDFGARSASDFTVKVGETGLKTITDNDTFLKYTAYDGEELGLITVITTLADGEQLFCTIDGTKTLYNGTGFTLAKITADVVVYITVEQPAAPVIAVGGTEESLGSQPISDYYDLKLDNEKGQYVFTFNYDEDPVYEGTDKDNTYRFDGWRVSVNGVDLTQPISAIMLAANGPEVAYHFHDKESFTVDFNVDGSGMDVTIEPIWVVTYTLTVEAPEQHVTVKVNDAEADKRDESGKYVYTFDTDASVTVTLEPGQNYRFSSVEVLGVEQVTAENRYDLMTLSVSLSENTTITIGELVEYANVQYTLEGVPTDDEAAALLRGAYTLKIGDSEEPCVAGQVYHVDVDTVIHFDTVEPEDGTRNPHPGYRAKIEGLNLTNCIFGNNFYNAGQVHVTGKTRDNVLTVKIIFEKLVQDVTVSANNATVKINGVQYADEAIECQVGQTVTVMVQAADKDDTAVNGYTVTEVKWNDTVLEATGEADEEGWLTYTFTMPSEPVTISIKILPKLSTEELFPDPTEPDAESTGAPTQGTWAAVDSDPEHPAEGNTLEIGANTLVVNGDPVTDIQSNDKTGGEVVYELTTEGGNTYTLAWFGKVEGYILALTDTTTSVPTLPARRAVSRIAAENTTYYVNPEHANDEVVAEKFSAFLGTWKSENVELAFTLGESGAQFSLNESPVKYLFDLENGHYLLIVGADAYDLTLTDTNTLKDNTAETEVTYKKAYAVTVEEKGKEEGNNSTYELKNGETVVTSGDLVAYGTTLTLTVTPAEGYDVEVKVNGGDPTKNEDGTYTVEVNGATTITITYTLKKYTVEVKEEGGEENGSYELKNGDATVNSSDLVNHGTTLTLTVTPVAHYTAEVKVGDAKQKPLADKTNTYSIVVTAETTITITYSPIQHTLTFEKDENVTVTVQNSAEDKKYAVGTEISFTIGVPAGYKIKNVQIKDGDTIPYENDAYTFTMPGHDVQVIIEVEIVAKFSSPEFLTNDKIQLSITVDSELDESTLRGAKLVLAEGKELANPEYKQADGKTTLSFDLTSLEIGTYTLNIKIGDAEFTVDDIAAKSQPYAENQYDLKADTQQLVVSAVEPSVWNFHNGGYANGVLNFYFFVKGYSAETVKNMKLIAGDNQIAATDPNPNLTGGVMIAYFDLKTIKTDGEYLLQLKIGEQTYNVTTNAVNNTFGSPYASEDGHVYTLSAGEGDQLKLTVSAATQEYKLTYTVTTDEGVEGCSAELKQGDATVQTGDSFAAGTELTLTLTLGEKCKATVDVVGATKNGSDNSYTITVGTSDFSITVTFSKLEEVDVKTLTITALNAYTDVHAKLTMSSADINVIRNKVGEQYNGYYLTVNGRKLGAMYSESGYEVVDDTSINVFLSDEINKGTIEFKWYNADNQLIAQATWNGTAPAEKFEVTVTVDGEVHGSYTLTKGGENVASGSKVDKDTELTLTVSPDATYKATVSVNGVAQSSDNNTYTIKVTTTTTITITYTKEGEEVEKSVSNFHSIGLFESSVAGQTKFVVSIWFFSTGYTEVDLKAAQLKIGEETVSFLDGADNVFLSPDGGNTKNKICFDISDLGAMDAQTVVLLLGGQEYEVKGAVDTGNASKSFNNKTYTIAGDANTQLTLTVSAESGGDEHPVDLSKGGEGDNIFGWYYYDGKGAANGTLQDGTVTFEFSNNSNGEWWGYQLFYKDKSYPFGTKINLSFDITSTKAGTIRFFENETGNKLITFENDGAVVHFNIQGFSVTQTNTIIKLYMADKDSARIDAATITISNLQIDVVESAPERDPDVIAAEIELKENKAYLVLTFTTKKCSAEQIGKFVLFSKDGSPELSVDNTLSQINAEGESKLYFDLSNVKTADRDYYLHLKIDGSTLDGGNGDVFLNPLSKISDNQITSGNYKYRLYKDGRNQLYIGIEDVLEFKASFEVDESTVYYVVNIKTAAYTEEQLQNSELYGNSPETTGHQFTAQKVELQADGSYNIYFNITVLRTKGDNLMRFYPHLNIQNGMKGDLRCDYTGEQSVTVNHVTYTFEMEYSMPCVDVTVDESVTQDKSAGVESRQLKQGETLTLTATVDQYDQSSDAHWIEAHVTVNGTEIKFSPQGLYCGDTLLEDGQEASGFRMEGSISEDELKSALYQGTEITIEIKIVAGEISLTYKVGENSCSVTVKNEEITSCSVTFETMGELCSHYETNIS